MTTVAAYTGWTRNEFATSAVLVGQLAHLGALVDVKRAIEAETVRLTGATNVLAASRVDVDTLRVCDDEWLETDEALKVAPGHEKVLLLAAEMQACNEMVTILGRMLKDNPKIAQAHALTQCSAHYAARLSALVTKCKLATNEDDQDDITVT